MKNFFTTCFLVFSTVCLAQMKVIEGSASQKIGEYKLFGVTYAEITKDGEVCTFTYRDDKFAQTDNYKSFTFNYSDIDTLYNLFTNFEGVQKGSEKIAEVLDKGKVYFTYGKTFGKWYAEVIHVDKALVGGKIRWMNENQLKNLFGR